MIDHCRCLHRIRDGDGDFIPSSVDHRRNDPPLPTFSLRSSSETAKIRVREALQTALHEDLHGKPQPAIEGRQRRRDRADVDGRQRSGVERAAEREGAPERKQSDPAGAPTDLVRDGIELGQFGGRVREGEHGEDEERRGGGVTGRAVVDHRPGLRSTLPCRVRHRDVHRQRHPARPLSPLRT